MDKLKGVAKGGWHPSGDRSIHRDTWKSDLKGMATGKKNDPYEAARNHQSAPLSTLRDPDSFGAPPKHSGVPGSNPATPSTPVRSQPSGGWGSVVPTTPSRSQQIQQRAAEEEAAKPPPGPYKVDTTGLRTDNLPPPPPRRVNGASPAPPPRTNSAVSSPPALPARHVAQPAQTSPPLPPRMNDHPDEYTPPPPPAYHEAVHPALRDPAAMNTESVNSLSQAGVSVPALGIGNDTTTAQSQPSAVQGHAGQLSELQQRFARMNARSQSQAPVQTTPTSTASGVAPAAHKKPPPPPPPKRAGLGNVNSRPSSSDASSIAPAPPPLPLSSKPRPS